MRPVDEAAIATLRTLPTDVLDPGTLTGLEKSIERDGIDGLTGAAHAVVTALVRKHGSPGDKGYSQMHPDSKGGGSGGSGGGDADGQAARQAARSAQRAKSAERLAERNPNPKGTSSTLHDRHKAAADDPKSPHARLMADEAIGAHKSHVRSENGYKGKIVGAKRQDEIQVGDKVALISPGRGGVRIVQVTGFDGFGQIRAGDVGKTGRVGKEFVDGLNSMGGWSGMSMGRNDLFTIVG